MKVVVRTTPDAENEGFDNYFELIVDDKSILGIGNYLNECPEDAYLCRDLNFVYDIPDLIKNAYEAGKNGDVLEITNEKEK